MIIKIVRLPKFSEFAQKQRSFVRLVFGFKNRGIQFRNLKPCPRESDKQFWRKVMEQEVEVNDGVDAVVDDRISALPGVVLQHLTFIPTKQVVQSTLLSKSWKHVWNTFPILIFDQNYFESNWGCSESKRKCHLRNFVDNTLQSHRRQRVRINNFTLVNKFLNTRETDVSC